ncbi:MAG: hypothetical protein LBE62_08125, partial [Azonexus sp.]|nr:hypothetical protein [Azonexus sp.]
MRAKAANRPFIAPNRIPPHINSIPSHSAGTDPQPAAQSAHPFSDRSLAMNNTNLDRLARKRAKAKLGWFIHAAI